MPFDVARRVDRLDLLARRGRRQSDVPAEPVALAAARARSPTIRAARSGCEPGVVLERGGMANRTPAATRIRYPPGARRTGDLQRRRRRRRRRRRAVRRADRRAHGRRRRARLGDAAGADRQLLGAGRARGRTRRRGLARPPPGRHRGGGPRTRAPLGGARCSCTRRPPACATSSGWACASTPTAAACSRSGSRAATPCAASFTPAAARPAGASCASSRRSSSTSRASRCSRARAPRVPGRATVAARGSCSRTAVRCVRARRSSRPAVPPRSGRGRPTRRARSGSGC